LKKPASRANPDAPNRWLSDIGTGRYPHAAAQGPEQDQTHELREASEALIEAFEDIWHWTFVPRPLSMKRVEDVPDPVSIYSKSTGAHVMKVSSRRSGTRRKNTSI
jgi:hypothetical protein